MQETKKAAQRCRAAGVSKFVVSKAQAGVVTSAKMRSHMARYARCGCGVSRSFDCSGKPARRLKPLRWMMTLAVLLGLIGYLPAQDTHRPITPKATPTTHNIPPTI